MNNVTLLLREKYNSKYIWTTFLLDALKVRISVGENIHLTVDRHRIIDDFTCIIVFLKKNFFTVLTFYHMK